MVSRFHSTVRPLLFAAVATALCGSAMADPAVTLKMKLKAGEQLVYQTAGKIAIPMPSNAQKGKSQGPLQELAFPVNAAQKISVVKVAGNGTAEVDLTVSGSTGPQTSGIGPSNKTTTAKATISPQGVLSMSKHETGANAAVGALTGAGTVGSITVYLPNHPVKPGDTWSVSVPVAALSATATAKVTYLKNSSIGHYKTAHLKIVFTIPVDAMVDSKSQFTKDKDKAEVAIKGTSTMTYEEDFAIAEGRIVKSVGDGSTSLSIAQKSKDNKPTKTQKVVAKVTMTSTLTQ
jgi:hypothetical protein